MAAVDDVMTYLVAQNLAGGSTGWTILRRRMLDDSTMVQSISLTEDGGREPETPAASGIGDAALGEAGVLVTVRAAAWDGDASLAKAQAILTALHGLRAVQLGGGGAPTYLGVRAMTTEPVFAGFDEQGRPLHTVAFRLLRAVA